MFVVCYMTICNGASCIELQNLSGLHSDYDSEVLQVAREVAGREEREIREAPSGNIQVIIIWHLY